MVGTDVVEIGRVEAEVFRQPLVKAVSNKYTKHQAKWARHQPSDKTGDHLSKKHVIPLAYVSS